MRMILTILAIGTGIWAEQHPPAAWSDIAPAAAIQVIPASQPGDAMPVACPPFWDV